MTWDWNWLLDPGNYYQSLIERRCQDTTFTQIGCQIASLCLICRVVWVIPRLGPTTRETWQQQRRRREREGCVSSVYSRGRTSTDQEPEKHLIYDLGLVLFGDRELKGDCDRGGSLSPWRENRECGQCLMGTGCESRGPGWGQVGTISIYWDIGSFPREWRPLTSVTQCDV